MPEEDLQVQKGESWEAMGAVYTMRPVMPLPVCRAVKERSRQTIRVVLLLLCDPLTVATIVPIVLHTAFMM